MYYPYFRGKQYELITIRENAKLLADSGFVPIIEPVKESTSGLERSVGEVIRADGECILIVNPDCGDHCKDGKKVKELIDRKFAHIAQLSVGFLLTSSMSVSEINALCHQYPSNNIALIHKGFEEGSDLADALANRGNVTRHVFLDSCGKLYRRHFRRDGRIRVLLRDGFKRRPNREYPDSEPFSDLYLTFRDEENMDGFGDFLIVGDDYFETGGPAYAVAIHLTYIDDAKDGSIYIRHFVSIRTETQTDPAGKFGEALDKLADEVNKPNSPILRTEAVKEFLSLHHSRHFPGLGYLKKLSMQHHIETLADYFKQL